MAQHFDRCGVSGSNRRPDALVTLRAGDCERGLQQACPEAFPPLLAVDKVGDLGRAGPGRLECDVTDKAISGESPQIVSFNQEPVYPGPPAVFSKRGQPLGRAQGLKASIKLKQGSPVAARQASNLNSAIPRFRLIPRPNARRRRSAETPDGLGGAIVAPRAAVCALTRPSDDNQSRRRTALIEHLSNLGCEEVDFRLVECNRKAARAVTAY